VPDVEAFARSVEEAGGKVVVPKMAIPGIGYQIYGRIREGQGGN
jgi:predicted enzyme related to lactoylglutathione lyase